MQKDYSDAVQSHEKAESLQPGFSNENMFWLGKAELALRKKKQACETFLKAKGLSPHYRNEFKIGVQTREFLLKTCRMRPEDIPDSSLPY
ncbi:unnamed protein product [Thelazia callipaeda]|uniref:TPR_REGION domain-containing protein n=1 Tax=Thelazia callipaeda TaxID=103827 RepID=A0A0N5D6K6_THECL|nr:unnamed protein product [Thelazia callipaeda]